MRFFKDFPTLTYDENTIATNVLFRFKIREAILNNEIAYYNYYVGEEDKPEIIADKYYGHPRYVWLVFLANDIIDPQFDWPLSYRDFISYLDKKYNTGTEQDYEVISRLQSTVHHYENSDGQTVLQADMGSGGSTVYYYDWEQNLNEAKRDIKIIDSRYFNKIMKEFKEIFR
jgi:hypothetical protein